MKNIYTGIFILLALIMASCSKEAGIGGRKTISGTVRYLNGANGSMEIAENAAVMITYGSTSSNANYNQTVLTDGEGKFHFDGLRKGEYFITARFTDVHGFIYSTAGYGITVKNKKELLNLDIELR